MDQLYTLADFATHLGMSVALIKLLELQGLPSLLVSIGDLAPDRLYWPRAVTEWLQEHPQALEAVKARLVSLTD